SSLTMRLHGQGAARPRGFQRSYRFEFGRGFEEIGRGPVSLGLSGEKDYDAPKFEGWKAVLLDRSQPYGSRAHAMHEMVMNDARRGLGVVATLLDDRDEEVRHEAAEWLAIRGDRRGLDKMVASLKEPRNSHHAASRLGNSGKKDYAAPIATAVRRILEASLRSGTLGGSQCRGSGAPARGHGRSRASWAGRGRGAGSDRRQFRSVLWALR